MSESGFVFVYTPTAVDRVPTVASHPAGVYGPFPSEQAADRWARAFITKRHSPFDAAGWMHYGVEAVTYPPDATRLYAFFTFNSTFSWAMNPELAASPDAGRGGSDITCYRVQSPT